MFDISWAVTYLIIALLAAIFGFTGMAGTAVHEAKILFVVFTTLFLISVIKMIFSGPKKKEWWKENH